MRTKLFVCAVIMLALYSPVHEIGHVVVAKVDSAEILSVNLFPHFKGFTLVTGSTAVNEFSFSSIEVLILFKMAGFIITFTPAVLLFVYLRRKCSVWWHVPFIWVMAAPGASHQDLIDIGRIWLGYTIGRTLSLAATISTGLMLIWYIWPTLSRLYREGCGLSKSNDHKMLSDIHKITHMNCCLKHVCKIVNLAL